MNIAKQTLAVAGATVVLLVISVFLIVAGIAIGAAL